MQLRFVERESNIPRPDLGRGVGQFVKLKILQQLIHGEWIDVPLVTVGTE